MKNTVDRRENTSKNCPNNFHILRKKPAQFSSFSVRQTAHFTFPIFVFFFNSLENSKKEPISKHRVYVKTLVLCEKKKKIIICYITISIPLS
jgi:hypothetical protein